MNQVESSSENKCQVCQQKAQHTCGGCRSVFYCCKEHQKSDWKDHKKICKPFKVQDDPALGRVMIASRSLPPGTTVLKEQPLIWGPSNPSIPICLGCAKAIDETNSRPCKKCGWPVCGDMCERSPSHLAECRFTTQRGNPVSVKNSGIHHPIYRCVMILRCLYPKQFLPKVWKQIDSMESHCDLRKQTAAYQSDKVALAQFMLRFFKLNSSCSEDEIMRIAGIVMINSHEIPLTDPPHVAIFSAQASFLENSCAANCTRTFTTKGELLVTSAKEIRQGEHLSICYTNPLWDTPNRRKSLLETKFLNCSCDRCTDPTEFGTHFSALKCKNASCSNGLLLPKSFTIPNTPDLWTCNSCSKAITSYLAHDILERVGRDLEELPRNDVESCKRFLETYEEWLSENHFYLTDIRLHLARILGQKTGLEKLGREDLNLKLDLCKSLMDLVMILAPAERGILGILMFEAHAAFTECARRRAEADSPERARFDLLEARKMLEATVDFLKNEPDQLPQGQIHRQAQRNLKDIDVILRKLEQTIHESL